ncbi:hypothetical protein FNAPI_11543 [Fusarium napiforme]|uniref:Uncharacterized protein n=1 Tax=Fusarium napiforme TaxID=42672 RepID=A0A8H5MNY1_9HYPO|nr:hypothetical protein FNAPI_11543 [Fusarium napiforme]
MPNNCHRAQGSTKSPFDRQSARVGYRRRRERRQRAAACEGGHVNGVQVVESHPSDAGHVGMTGDRDEASTLVQQTAEIAVRESLPHLKATRLAHDMSTLAIANPAV